MGRMERINQQVKREIGKIILQDLSDPRLQFVSITHVKTSNDLRSARVLYSMLGDSSDADEIQQVLTRAAGMIRRLLSSKLNLRNTPELTFSYDKSIEESIRIDETLKEFNDESE